MIVRPTPPRRRPSGPPQVQPGGFLAWLVTDGLQAIVVLSVLLTLTCIALVLLARAYLTWGVP